MPETADRFRSVFPDMKKKIAITIIVLLIIGAAAWALNHFVFSRSKAAAQDKIYVQLVGSLQSYGGYGNRYSGVVDPQKSEKVEFDTEYKLKELLVAEGDHVKAGDPLFIYDTESVTLEIDQINLEIQKLEKDIETSTAQIEELTKLMDKAPDSEKLDYSTQIAELQTDIAQEQYDVKSKQADIKKKEASISNAAVTSPLEGIVKSIADLDSIMSGNNFDRNGNIDNTYITITAEGDFRIKGSISESNIYEISQGERVIIRSRVNDDTWHGTIASINTQENESNEREYSYDNGGDRATKYPFYVELDSAEGLMLGQHVTIELDTGIEIRPDGIWLGSGFIVRDEEDSPYVWAAEAEGASLKKRPVVLGQYIEETNQYEITSGLTKNDYIAWPDAYCREGAPTTSEYIIPEDGTGEMPAGADMNTDMETFEEFEGDDFEGPEEFYEDDFEGSEDPDFE